FGPAFRALRGAGQSDRASSPLSTPILRDDHGKMFQDSQRILMYLSERFSNPRDTLYSTDEAAQLEREFHDQLGPYTRRLAYIYLLQDRKTCLTLAKNNVSSSQTRLLTLIFPLWKRALKKALKAFPQRKDQAIEKIEQALTKVAQKLGDGRPYLLGEQFSAADLSFACMIAPALSISKEDGYGATMPQLGSFFQEYLEYTQRWRESTAGQFALRMFQQEKQPRTS
ncbi:MAG: glutathione S-transferase family protein, partial [Myxococcota bacterium]